jgi:CheY-like chemotaxis protein
MLKKLGFATVVGVNNGLEAVEIEKREKFDLVCCDLMMPE